MSNIAPEATARFPKPVLDRVPRYAEQGRAVRCELPARFLPSAGHGEIKTFSSGPASTTKKGRSGGRIHSATTALRIFANLFRVLNDLIFAVPLVLLHCASIEGDRPATARTPPSNGSIRSRSNSAAPLRTRLEDTASLYPPLTSPPLTSGSPVESPPCNRC
jgi:hypothetical protein